MKRNWRHFFLTAIAAAGAQAVAQVNVLSWVRYSDQTPTGEAAHTHAIITTGVPGAVITTSTTLDATTLRAELAGQRVFLCPEIEVGGYASSTGTAFAPVLQEFVAAGGIAIFCMQSSSPQFVTDTGLTNRTIVGLVTSGTADIQLPNHFLLAGVATPISHADATVFATTTDPQLQVVLSMAGNPARGVVMAKPFGAGMVVCLGYDYWSSNTSIARILVNAVTWDCTGDCDSDGISDCQEIAEGSPDCNRDGIPDSCQLATGDCNSDGILDACQITGHDCNGDGILDECQLPGHDCNNNAVLDSCETIGTVACEPDDTPVGSPIVCPGFTAVVSPANGPVFSVTAPASTGTRVYGRSATTGDWAESAATLRVNFAAPVQSVSLDIVANDSNDRGFLTAFRADNTIVGARQETPFFASPGFRTLTVTSASPEIAYILASGIAGETVELDHLVAETMMECNENGIPDVCEPDCNTNGVPDDCDIRDGTSIDANGNGLPDECEAEDVAVAVVLRRQASAFDAATALPASDSSLRSTSEFVAELWFSDIGAVNTGLAGGYVDLHFDPAKVQALSIQHRPPFTLLPGGDLDNVAGQVAGLGGIDSTFSCIGAAPNWVRVAVVEFQAACTTGPATISLAASLDEIGCCQRGGIPAALVAFGSSSVNLEQDCTYDLTEDNFINAGDLGVFAGAWQSAPADPNWNARCDFDCSGRVAAGDIGWFAPQWQEQCADVTALELPPCRRCSEPAPIRRPDDVRVAWRAEALAEKGVFSVQVFVRDLSEASGGLSALYLDLDLAANQSKVDVLHVEVAPEYGLLQRAEFDSEKLHIGGATLDPAVATDDWTRLAVITLQNANSDLPPRIALSVAEDGAAGYGRGAIAPEHVTFAAWRLPQHKSPR